MSPDLTFAVAAPDRLGEVERLIRSAFTPYIGALGREIAPDAYAWFGGAIAEGDIYLALDGSEMVGAIVTRRQDKDLELALIGVSPTRQKSGIASWLIGQVEALARTRGTEKLWLMTAEMMEDRVRLYGRHGFVIVRRGPPEHGKDAHIRVYMEKRLNEPHRPA